MSDMPVDFRGGWIPDLPDFFDSSEEEVAGLLVAKPPTILPPSVDLRKDFPPIRSQGELGSCSAFSVIALIEYLEEKLKNEVISASPLFLYYVTRRYEKRAGDSGATLRGTIKALRIFGCPPNEYYRYIIGKFEEEPGNFAYNFALSYKPIIYYRTDPKGRPTEEVLSKTKETLSRGFPLSLGFTIFSNALTDEVASTGNIPMPSTRDKIMGGHAITLAGYTDEHKKFIFRNSWGTGWGDKGYVTLPYDFVLKGLASDIWVITSLEYESLGGK